MNKRLLWSCIVLALPGFASGQQMPVTMGTTPKANSATNGVSVPAAPATNASSANAPLRSKLAETLEARTRGAWAAFKKKDKETYAKFLADDFQAVESDGDGERAKAKVLREVEHCLYTDYLLQLYQVQQIDPDNALATYESTMRFPKGAMVHQKRIFISEWWGLRNGEWKMIRYQETNVR